ncbi:MAG: hypothetical protein HC809_08715, partial [Gammaproteobacteria bacterium]|nr:hypothetical protein [Gammaproteobacteria bacterium]
MASLAELQQEIFHGILVFLTNDAPSIVRLSLTCQILHRRIDNNDNGTNGENGNNDDIWKEMVDRRWSAPDPQTMIIEQELYHPSIHRPDERYCDLFLRRIRLDRISLSTLQNLAEVLQQDLGLVVGDGGGGNNNKKDVMVPPNYPRINNNWTTSDGLHEMVFPLGLNLYDSFRDVAYRIYQKCWCCEDDGDNEINADIANNNLSTHDKVVGYLAALCVQNFHFTHFLKNWIRLSVAL